MAEQQQATTALATTSRKGVVSAFAERFDLEPGKVMSLVANTVFKSSGNEPPLSNEEVAAALIVCNAYELNPFTKEIFCFRSKGKLLIVVGVDGWSAIVNRQKQLNGIEFEEHFDDKGVIKAVTCKIHRKDCALPIVVTEYTHECKRDTIPWNTMPIRMTRNRAFVQCARVAFSISGIVDDDEARTIEGNPEFTGKAIIDGSATRTEAVKNVVAARARNARSGGQAKQAEPEPAQQVDNGGEQEHEHEPAEESREQQHEQQHIPQTEPAQQSATQSYF